MVIVHILHDLHELPPKFNVSLRVKNKIKKKTNNQCAVCVKKKKKKDMGGVSGSAHFVQI